MRRDQRIGPRIGPSPQLALRLRATIFDNMRQERARELRELGLEAEAAALEGPIDMTITADNGEAAPQPAEVARGE